MKKIEDKRIIRVRFCPKCKETDLIMVAGGIVGLWRCRKCGYAGSIFPVKEIYLNKLGKNKREK